MKCSRFFLISISFLVLFGTAMDTVSARQRVFRSRQAVSSGTEQAAESAKEDIKSNAFISVSEKFIAVPFKTQRKENVDINEMINGTHITGSGIIEVKSSCDIISGIDSAVIAVNADGTLTSSTVGRKSIVTAFSDTTTLLHGVKNIYISPEGITTSGASATAEQDITDSSMSVACKSKLIRSVIKNAAADQRAETAAIGKQRTVNRFEDRLDTQIDERIAKVNENYQKKFREPFQKDGLYPQVLNFSSTEDRLNAFFVFANPQQAAADSSIPQNIPQGDVLFQVHQTAVNNLASQVLAGNTFNEDEVSEKLKNPDNPYHFLSDVFSRKNRNKDDKPLTITFAKENPAEVSFTGSVIKALIRITALKAYVEEEEKTFRDLGLEITLSYKVKVNGSSIILEQTEKPAVVSRAEKKVGFGQIAESRSVRTIIERRLAEMDKQRLLEELKLKGEWEDKGKLVPAFIDSQNGWFTLSYNWIEK